MSRLRERLRAQEFVVTTEMVPPKGTDLTEFESTAKLVKGKAHAVNVTDNHRAIMHLSSLGGAAVLVREGLEPILQLTCRDRNRIAMQSELLSAWVLGVRNVLTMTGDPVDAGDHPTAKPVFDVSSAELIRLIDQLNNGKNGAAQALEGKTDFFCGATVNPCIEPFEPEMKRFAEKIQAGARFFQTQAIYDLDAFARFMDVATKHPIYVIAGVIPLRSAAMARFLNEKVPGIRVPADMIERLEKSSEPQSVGLDLAGGLVQGLKTLCHGIHLMIIGKEKNFELLDRLATA